MNREKLRGNTKKTFEKLKSDKKALFIIAVGLLVMVLVLTVDFRPNEKGEVSSGTADFEKELEEELCGILSQIKNAGRVRVMITFESSKEKVFAFDTDENVESRESLSNTRKTKNQYIIVDNGDSETGLELKDIYPRVRGVAVVCDGAENPVIKEQIVSVVSALFDIKSTNISVAEMAD